MCSTNACICMCMNLYKDLLLYSSAEAGNTPEEVTCFSDSSTSEAHSLRSFQSDSCDDNGEIHALRGPKTLTYPQQQKKKKNYTAQRIFEVSLATLEKFSNCVKGGAVSSGHFFLLCFHMVL